jgi:hypothetical protein
MLFWNSSWSTAVPEDFTMFLLRYKWSQEGELDPQGDAAKCSFYFFENLKKNGDQNTTRAGSPNYLATDRGRQTKYQMAGITKEEGIFLTAQKTLHDDGVCDGSNEEENGDISFGNMKDALLEIEAFDAQLDNLEFECNQCIDDNVPAFVDCQPNVDLSGDSAVPTSNFSATIDIKDIFNDNRDNKMVGCVDAIERNINLCSMTNHLLTVEEEERIAEMMLQDEEDMEKYGFCIPSIEKNREVELDELLLGLGYDIENDDKWVECENTESEEEIKLERGDPTLRELAKERTASLREKRVDQAMQKLLLEPLPHVVRIPQKGITECQDEVSLLPVVCEETTLTASVADEVICHLVLKLKKQFEDEGTVLANHESIRALARSIMDQEFSKKSGLL